MQSISFTSNQVTLLTTYQSGDGSSEETKKPNDHSSSSIQMFKDTFQVKNTPSDKTVFTKYPIYN